jgi:hypothetical protein
MVMVKLIIIIIIILIIDRPKTTIFKYSYYTIVLILIEEGPVNLTKMNLAMNVLF